MRPGSTKEFNKDGWQVKPPRITEEPATVLPRDARDALVAASQIPNEEQRARAVQRVTDSIKMKYPQFFN